MDVLDLAYDGDQPQRRESQSTESKVRRTACDRCRGHKLRCDRLLATSEHDRCDRCVRADSDCITTPALPTGRPRLHQDQFKIQDSRPKKRKKATPQVESAPTSSNVQALPTLSPYDMASESFNFPFLLGDGLPTPTEHQDTALAAEPLVHATDVTSVPFSGSSMTPDMLAVFDADNMINDPLHTQAPLGGHFTNSGFKAHQVSSTSSEMPVNDKKRTLYRLSQLNSALFQHLTDCDIAGPENKYSFLSPNESPAAVPRGAESMTAHLLNNTRPTDKLAIGQMLSFLQEFLGILRYFVVTLPVSSAPRLSSRSNTSDTSSQSEFDSESDSDANLSSTQRSVETSVTQQPLTDTGVVERAHGNISTDSAESVPVTVDYPTMLALMTCYVSLIRLYRHALEKLLSSFQRTTFSPMEMRETLTPSSSTTTASQNSSLHSMSSYSVPAVLPGLHIDGFTLTNHRTLQMAVFMQVSMDLLRRVERAVAGIAALDERSGPRPDGNMALLDSMLQREAATSGPAGRRGNPESKEIGLSSLRSLVKKIRRSVRDNVCLQLEEADFCPALDGFDSMVL